MPQAVELTLAQKQLCQQQPQEIGINRRSRTVPVSGFVKRVG
jgi:hypothetical protein